MPTHLELTKNHRFQVYIGNNRLAFSKVSGLGSGMDKEVYVEGGSMYYPHVMQTPSSQLRTIRMERGVQKDTAIIQKLRPGVYIPCIQIIVMGENGKPYYEYYLEDAWVTRWEVVDLDAMDGKVMIDTFEVEYVRSDRSSVK